MLLRRGFDIELSDQYYWSWYS